MKKVNRVFSTITISLLILFSLAISGTYLSDYLISVNWFGDYTTDTRTTWGGYQHWGARHYWYNWGVSLLFITSLARSVVKVVMIIEKEESE